MPENNVISVKDFGIIPNHLKEKANKVLQGENLSNWLDYLKRIKDAGYGDLVSKAFSKTILNEFTKQRREFSRSVSSKPNTLDFS